MDIKLKSSRSIRLGLALLAILLAVLVSFLAFPVIGGNAQKEYENLKLKLELEKAIDPHFMKQLVQGSYVLYYEEVTYEGPNGSGVKGGIEQWEQHFEHYRNAVDYYARTVSGNGTKAPLTNTTRNLGALLGEGGGEALALEELQSWYQCYFILRYDGEGNPSVEGVWSQNGGEDTIVKNVLQAERECNFSEVELESMDEVTEKSGFVPRNFQVVYGIPKTINMGAESDWENEYLVWMHAYYIAGSSVLYSCILVVLALVMLILNSNRIFKGTIDFKRKGRWYLMEPAIVGFIASLSMEQSFLDMNVQYVNVAGTKALLQLLADGTYAQVLSVGRIALSLLLLYGMWYVSLCYLRPVFNLGPKEYIRQYSLVYLFGTRGIAWLKGRLEKVKDEIAHVDFSCKTIRLIRRIVVLNFLVLAVLSCFWFLGIFALVIYSVALFLILKRQYDRVEKDYQALMRATAHIAQGELEYEDTSDWGMFEPFKQELAKIRSGFSRAVEEEVKSQRMKTELITNVSHDLKTPLTAITTYVELLKDPELTPEQQKAYVEILDKKSRRLKSLVEDLFEVSKAASNTIKLDLMEVDLVNLIKQVWMEHEASFSKMGLTVKWSLPEEKVTRMLDNQKTWRIFENLFGNIEKYAMQGSRVYIEVVKKAPVADAPEDSGVEITIKNMSAQELCVSGEELTQRFARGDSSRSTEGSGLGLAIAKSFTQAQKGQFKVTVDGDLFKVLIRWK